MRDWGIRSGPGLMPGPGAGSAAGRDTARRVRALVGTESLADELRTDERGPDERGPDERGPEELLPDEWWFDEPEPDEPGMADSGRTVPSRPVARLEEPGTGGLTGWLARRGVRIDPGRRAALVVGLVAVMVAVVAGWWLLHGRPHASALGPPTPVAASPSHTPTTSTSAPPLVVDVVGKVRHPGVYRLPAGSRVADALHAAGGALPGIDLTPLNLARRLVDGEQVAVGVPGSTRAGGSAPAATPGGSAGPGGSAAPVDLNTATEQQLEALPGVGPVLAQHILDWRAAHGRFASVDQLQAVDGIGPAKFGQLRALVTV